MWIASAIDGEAANEPVGRFSGPRAEECCSPVVGSGGVAVTGFSSSRDDEAHGIGKSAVIFLIVALALLLAIGFFYLTKDSADRNGADTVLDSIESADNVAISVGDAARDTIDNFRPGK